MSYVASPRPTYPGPAPIPYTAATHHLWGDEFSAAERPVSTISGVAPEYLENGA